MKAIARCSVVAIVAGCAIALSLGFAACSPAPPSLPPAPSPSDQSAAPPEPSVLPPDSPEPAAPPPPPIVCAVSSPVFGTLSLTLPGGAMCDVKDLGAGGQMTADIALPGKEAVRIRLTLLGPDALMPDFGLDPSLLEMLTAWWNGLGDAFSAQPPPVQRVEQNGLRGFYAIAQDPAPNPGEAAFAWNGFFCMHGVVIMLGATYPDAGSITPEALIGLLDAATWQSADAPQASADAGGSAST